MEIDEEGSIAGAHRVWVENDANNNTATNMEGIEALNLENEFIATEATDTLSELNLAMLNQRAGMGRRARRSLHHSTSGRFPGVGHGSRTTGEPARPCLCRREIAHIQTSLTWQVAK